MNLEAYAHSLVEFVKVNQAWTAPVVFALAFAESLAFISLVVPAWGVLVAIGLLMGPGGVAFEPVWIAASVGAALGDWLSYWIGNTFKTTVAGMWPLSRHPQLIPRGEVFVKRWGMAGIFVGRFFGPLRAAVPLVAGIFAMPRLRFQIANFSSAFVWAWVLLQIGDVGSKAIMWLWQALGFGS